MRNALVAALLGAVLAVSASAERAVAEVVITIDKSTQLMSVAVSGFNLYTWAVSTGLGGGPPSGSYTPLRLERYWYSRKYGRSPMPHAIFFHKGYAMHGTNYVSRLGRRASHGCVRLHPANAAQLFALVRSEGVGNTRIVIR